MVFSPSLTCLPREGFEGGWPGGDGGNEPDERAWRYEAACRELPTDLFFPIGHGPRAQAQVRLAKEICSGCDVRAQCLAYALATNARYGVFGGLAEDERREFRRRASAALRLSGAPLEESA